MKFKKGTCKNCKKFSMIECSVNWWHTNLCELCISEEINSERQTDVSKEPNEIEAEARGDFD